MMRLIGLVLRAAVLSIGLFGVVYAIALLAYRPLDTVEGELLFEASRLRSGLSLWTHPQVGANEYGAVPARYYVLYTYIWPAIISLAPTKFAIGVGRAIACLSYYGGLAWIVLRAPRERRLDVLVAAAFAGGVFMLVRAGVNGSADSLAVLLAAVALHRGVKKGELDAIAGILFALAAWTKPNVIGVALGAILFTILTKRLRAWPMLLGALCVTLAMIGIEQFASRGLWIEHLLRSTGQAMNATVWAAHVVPRFMFLGLPHVGVIAYAWRARRDRGVSVALVSLATSLAWALFSMAKIGSATHYWLEPSMAAVIVVATVPRQKSATSLPIATTCLALLLAVLNARSIVLELPRLRSTPSALEHARKVCALGPTDVAIGEHPGIEMDLNQRIVATPFQLAHMQASDLEPWKHDIRKPEVRCLVMESDLLEQPLDRGDSAHDRFNVPMREALRTTFVLADQSGAFWTYRKR